MRKQLLYIFTAILMFSSMAAFAQDHFYESLFKKGFDVVIVENEGVKNFLDDRSYDKPDLTSKYSYSIVKKYSSHSGGGRQGEKDVFFSPWPL